MTTATLTNFTVCIDDGNREYLMWSLGMQAPSFAAAAAIAETEVIEYYADHPNVRWKRAEIVVYDGSTGERFPINWPPGLPEVPEELT
jgi:hypothetical protein